MWLVRDSRTWNLLYVLDLVFIGQFFVSYYRRCYRKGYRIDFWHASLFISCVLPNMLLLPFARSELNGIVLGPALWPVIEVVPTVFLITLVGYTAILIGGGLWRFQVGLGLRQATARVLDLIPRGSMMLMSSPSVLVFQTGLCLLFQVGILATYFSQSGFGFDLRGYTFANPTVRPIALIASNYSVIIASHCFARYIQKRERALLKCTLLLTFGLLFFGARANLVSIYINVLLCYMLKLRNRISLFRIVSIVAIIMTFGFYLQNVRAGEYSLTTFFASLAFMLFYGTNLSDLRDFAWVYSGWDHVYWGGKTYLVAFMSFVPRFASQFRETWGMGPMTSSAVGFDPQLFTGLRPGVFGEGFFNFGLLGVVAVGLVLGVILRHIDTATKQALAPPSPSIMKAFASATLGGVASCLAVTAGFSSLYILAGVYFFSWFCLTAHRMFQPQRASNIHAKLT